MNEELLKNVDHPEHYNCGGYECIDVMEKKAELTAEAKRLTEQVETAREELRWIKAEGNRY